MSRNSSRIKRGRRKFLRTCSRAARPKEPRRSDLRNRGKAAVRPLRPALRAHQQIREHSLHPRPNQQVPRAASRSGKLEHPGNGAWSS